MNVSWGSSLQCCGLKTPLNFCGVNQRNRKKICHKLDETPVRQKPRWSDRRTIRSYNMCTTRTSASIGCWISASNNRPQSYLQTAHRKISQDQKMEDGADSLALTSDPTYFTPKGLNVVNYIEPFEVSYQLNQAPRAVKLSHGISLMNNAYMDRKIPVKEHTNEATREAARRGYALFKPQPTLRAHLQLICGFRDRQLGPFLNSNLRQAYLLR